MGSERWLRADLFGDRRISSFLITHANGTSSRSQSAAIRAAHAILLSATIYCPDLYLLPGVAVSKVVHGSGVALSEWAPEQCSDRAGQSVLLWVNK
jgi:hypothetical protein